MIGLHQTIIQGTGGEKRQGVWGVALGDTGKLLNLQKGAEMTMKRVKSAILVIIGLALMLLVVQNTAPVQTRFLWMVADIPAVVLLFLVATGGFIAGVLATWLLGRGSKINSEKSSRSKVSS